MNESLHTKDNEIWKGKDHENRTVRLYVPERDHILNGHDIMGYNFTAIYDTVQSPRAVYKSGESDNREIYFKNSALATYSPKFDTKAVVQYNEDNSEGYIVTAFPTRKEGGNIGERTYPKD